MTQGPPGQPRAVSFSLNTALRFPGSLPVCWILPFETLLEEPLPY